MKIDVLDSPNQNARPDGTVVNCIVLHACAHPDPSPAGELAVVSWLMAPVSKVSYHDYVSRSGERLWSIVRSTKRAWHAGVSEHLGRANVNDFSVGVCLANKNDGEAFPPAQIAAAAAYCAALVLKHPNIRTPNGQLNITTHALCARPLGRKTDPKGLDLAAFIRRVDRELSVRPT